MYMCLISRRACATHERICLSFYRVLVEFVQCNEQTSPCVAVNKSHRRFEIDELQNTRLLLLIGLLFLKLCAMDILVRYAFPVIVSAFWGLSTPFLRRQSKGIETVRDPSKGAILNWLGELKFMFLNWKYLAPFICNQLGSVLYVVTLGDNDLSLIVPLVNSMTFIFVFIGDMLVEESKLNKTTFLGIVLIASGICICIYSKL